MKLELNSVTISAMAFMVGLGSSLLAANVGAQTTSTTTTTGTTVVIDGQTLDATGMPVNPPNSTGNTALTSNPGVGAVVPNAVLPSGVGAAINQAVSSGSNTALTSTATAAGVVGSTSGVNPSTGVPVGVQSTTSGNVINPAQGVISPAQNTIGTGGVSSPNTGFTSSVPNAPAVTNTPANQGIVSGNSAVNGGNNAPHSPVGGLK
jgi:hypothetical protein